MRTSQAILLAITLSALVIAVIADHYGIKRDYELAVVAFWLSAMPLTFRAISKRV